MSGWAGDAELWDVTGGALQEDMVCTITEAQVSQVTITHAPEGDGMIEGKLLPK